MTNKKKDMDFLDALSETLGSSEGQSPEEIKEELRNEGIDVDGKLNRLMQSVNDISMASKRRQLDVVKEQRKEMENNRSSLMSRFNDWTKEQILARIKEHVGTLGEDVGFAYRDLESRSLEDMKSLLEDLELTMIRYEREKSDDDK